jgi:hypothetical protein
MHVDDANMECFYILCSPVVPGVSIDHVPAR